MVLPRLSGKFKFVAKITFIICGVLAVIFLLRASKISRTPLININTKNDVAYEHSKTKLKNVDDENKKYSLTYIKKNYYKKYIKGSNEKKNYPGYKGKAVLIEHGDEKSDKQKDKHYWEEYHKYEFNVLASDMIPIDRELPLKVPQLCSKLKYPLNLPTASIIIVFHNEANSTLLRTVNSAYSRSPFHLIRELILVDDNSDINRYPHLGKPLENFIKKYPDVKIIRAEKRIGLTQAKLRGAKIAVGDVLVFLDSHCECWDGWLEPLLYGVYKNPKAAIVPDIEAISYKDFSITNAEAEYENIAIFTFDLEYTWHSNGKMKTLITKSPTMAGGLFAMDRKYFYHFGSYDNEMLHWGGENLEMSFRLWMCGSEILINHCSQVGHVYRVSSPHSVPASSVIYNKVRTARVWLDDFTEYFLKSTNTAKVEYGDLTSRLKLREDLQCKNFDWYLKNVATMVRIPDKHPYAYGYIMSAGSSDKLCLDSMGTKYSLSVQPCHFHGGNQNFVYNHFNEIKIYKHCFDHMGEAKVSLVKCHNSNGNQAWKHEKNGQIISLTTNMCVTLTGGSTDYTIILAACDTNNQYQKWTFQEYSNEI